jgi:acyl dehydratase
MNEPSTFGLALPSHFHIPSLEELPPFVGQDLVLTDYYDVSQKRIDLFAEATDDRQWIHVDVERARQSSPFGRTVAHGFLTLSLLGSLLVRSVTIDGIRLGINSGMNYVRYPSAVPAGGRIRARVHLRDTKKIRGGAEVTWFITAHCKGNLLPCCLVEWIVRYMT